MRIKSLTGNVQTDGKWHCGTIYISLEGTNEHHKQPRVIEYSQIANKYTILDAYPLPQTDGIIGENSHYSVCSI